MDGDRVATAAYKKPLTLWDLEGGRALCTVENDLGVSRHVRSLTMYSAFSFNSATLLRVHLALPHAVSLHSKTGTLSIWNVEEGRRVRSIQLEKQVRFKASISGQSRTAPKAA